MVLPKRSVSVFSLKGHTGTGFFITDDGYLVSNYHVVKDATKGRLLTGLRRVEVASATQAGAGFASRRATRYAIH
ncbi:MAG: hypothetical protein WBN22_11245 [Verrucomicrobiia bacterium]